MITVYTYNKKKCWNFRSFQDARKFFHRLWTGEYGYTLLERKDSKIGKPIRNVFILNWSL